MEKINQPKTKKEVKPRVKLISYTLKAVIPTGQYANIQPEITVQAQTIGEAYAFITPHLEGLYKEYHYLNNQVAQPSENIGQPTKDPSTSFIKANNAIESCMTKEALEIVKAQVHKSVKLTDDEKLVLIKVMTEKYSELDAIK